MNTHLCNMRGRLVGVFVPPSTPTASKQQRKSHTEISISYKTDWPIRSGYLLVLMTYLNPLFWSMLAIWLGTFFSCQLTCCLFGGLRRNGRETSLLPRILLFSLHHLYFLSGFPTYTSCLANQRLFKTWLKDCRQFSRTRKQLRKTSSRICFVLSQCLM